MAIENNIRRIYWYRIFSCMIFYLPIFVLFLLDNGLSATQVMILQSYYFILIVLLDVPTGVFADRYGRKKAIVISTVIYFISIFAYGISSSFSQFFIAETLFAFAGAFWSGTDSAFIYDTLKSLKQEHKFKKVFGTFYSINFLVWGLAGLLGGFLAQHSLRLPFYLSLIPVGISLLIAFTLTEPRHSKKIQLSYFNHMNKAVTYASKHRYIRFILIYYAVLYGLSEVVWFLYQPFFIRIDLPLQWFGVITFLIFTVSAIASKLSHRIDEMFGEKKVMVFMIAVPAISFIMMAVLRNYYALIFPLFAAFSGGLYFTLLDSYINKHVSSDNRATTISLKNLSGNLLFSIIAPFFGWIVDLWNVETAFFLSGAVLVVEMIIISSIFSIKSRSKKE